MPALFSGRAFSFSKLRIGTLRPLPDAHFMFNLIVGLGNPGRQYEDTRHNVGFMLLNRLALSEGVAFQSVPRWQSHTAKLRDGTLLLKPQTFMNLSGRALQQITSFHKWTPDQILVIYDDIALPLGTLRFREKGSAGGHNGIKSPPLPV